MLWSRRSVFLGLVVGGPVVLAAALRLAEISGRAVHVQSARGRPAAMIYGMMIWLIYVRFLVPVLGVFYGTSLIADEIDDKTLTYLFTRPIQRAAVIVGKYLAYLVCTVLLLLPSVVIVFFLVVPLGEGGSIAGLFPTLLTDLGMLVLGLAAYGARLRVRRRASQAAASGGLALRTRLGTDCPARPRVPETARRSRTTCRPSSCTTCRRRAGARALLQIFREVPPLSTSLIGLAVIVGVGLWLAGRTVERREYVLEQ